ncbi:hypothetical protein R1T16_17495 [Flavobacterium sp. DG1-102-2]|uniref:hypothetical protein n=1 Tax=Flavobacterium sp. DG1-102-2 TaxID=3081663 RepID=UPI00294A0B17|nr:hypothetical protein [Flavobacterium sp. DG1-102-2]MDV6170235.1 hypothetical protein [Flavobacterium sp. DG1-102-2]
MNAYEFIVRMKDYASSGLRSIAQSVGLTQRGVNGLDNSMRNTEKTAGLMGSSMSKLKNIIVSVFAVAAIWSFTNRVVEARAEYEKFSAVLTNAFQSADVGEGALNMLTQFAAETPYQLNELTGAFVKLVNRGFNPVKDELRKMGDLAASQGKGFDQLTEAILDAESGEFERMKEFGIKASKAGDQVSFSFKGITRTVQNNAAAIRQAIMEYGNMKGVAGSMEAISKTLGGRISNLKDQWDGLLVAVGGESGGLFIWVIETLSQGIAFLKAHIADITMWFEILWSMLQPVVYAVQAFLQAAFGFDDVGTIITGFGNAMAGVLLIVDWLTTGLTALIEILTPYADIILVVAAAYWVWNNAIGVYNALMLVNPVTWIVLGIMALIMVIGMVIKYTSGWGESWKHTVNGAKFLWQAYTDYVRANFNLVVQGIMIGINKIKEGWYTFKEAVGMGDSDENQKMLAQIAADTEARKKSISDGYKKMVESAVNAKKEFSQVGIKVDTEGIKKDFQALKDKFGGSPKANAGTSAYDDFVKNQSLTKGKGKDGDKTKGDSIVSGGAKMTHITINIDKLQDDTKIYVDKAEKGIDQMGEKIQEMILRAVNSVNQMQTG